jgi:hypothetical protein
MCLASYGSKWPRSIAQGLPWALAPSEGVTKLLALPEEEMAIDTIERVFARRGYTTQPGVSTPGTSPNRAAP